MVENFDKWLAIHQTFSLDVSPMKPTINLLVKISCMPRSLKIFPVKLLCYTVIYIYFLVMNLCSCDLLVMSLLTSTVD